MASRRASSTSTKRSATERSPLVPKTDDARPLQDTGKTWFGPVRRVYFTSFLIASAFAFTQTSLMYAFRLMTCDEYYKMHRFGGPHGADRCRVPSIEAETARNIALMSSTTTFFSIVNVFVVGWEIRHSGVKVAMFTQTAWAALRNLCQIYAQYVGGKRGINIIQVTQAINMLGSGGGYQLAGNAYIAALASEQDRTGMFGVLSGMAMLGNSVGMLAGGLFYRFIDPLAPFYTAFILLVVSCLFGWCFLPYIPPPPAPTDGQKSKSIFEPLRIFVPRKHDVGGRMKRDYNLMFLGLGAFFSVFATGYVGMGLQLVGTNVYGFKPLESGIMLSFTLFVRAIFLSLCFPAIISYGRKYMSSRSASAPPSPIEDGPAAEPESPSTAVDEPISPLNPTRQPPPPAPTDAKHGSAFDLVFLQWSIFLDAVLTALVSLSQSGWHLYLAAGILPFASGTGSAARGVTLDFVVPELRSDALGAIALVEKVAFVSTTGAFGYIFSLLSQVEKPMWIFLINAAVALLGFALLIPVRMPRPGQPLFS